MYQIEVSKPRDAAFTAEGYDSDSNDTIASDADALGYSDFFALVPGQHAHDWDALFW
jgi:hypothetical protein